MKILLLGGCGYIGSSVYTHLKHNFNIQTVDLEWFGNYVNKNNLKVNYNTLDTDFYSQFQVVILLAAHSSVNMCDKEPLNSFENNVVNFVNLLYKLKSQKLIYASSSVVYNGLSGICDEEEHCFQHKTHYDIGKSVIDYYARISGIEFYGLRLGTVNGYSINFRNDIMINKMYCTSLESKKIELYNKCYSRPILGINDLCLAIEQIVVGDDKRGIYNLCSFNSTILSLANRVSEITKAEIIDKGSTPTYDFSMSNNKFQNNYNFTFQDSTESIVESMSDVHLNKNGR